MMLELHIEGQVSYDRIDFPFPHKLFYYCSSCGCIYANLRPAELSSDPYLAVSGLCSSCPGHNFLVPGTLETVRVPLSRAPFSFLLHQFNREYLYYLAKETTDESSNSSGS
jgi:hypothetical protein